MERITLTENQKPLNALSESGVKGIISGIVDKAAQIAGEMRLI